MRENVNVTQEVFIFIKVDFINVMFSFQNRRNCFLILKLKGLNYLWLYNRLYILLVDKIKHRFLLIKVCF